MELDYNYMTPEEEAAIEQARRNRAERRAARLRRQRRRKIILTVGGAALAVTVGVFLGASISRSREPSPSAPDLPLQAAITATPVVEHTIEKGMVFLQEAEYAAAVTESPAPPPPEAPPEALLDSIPLDATTQMAIFDLCDESADLFCAVMAMAWTESRFTPDAVGDEGRSVGMMQINTRYHTERMERLGVTNLTDPVQCVAVAIDYLKELRDRYNFGWIDGHAIYMAYNAGPDGARDMMSAGTYSTEYSRGTMALQQEYLIEMEGTT